MKDKEFNLSDKVYNEQETIPNVDFILKEDVKEFIKSLKQRIRYNNGYTPHWVIEIINELVGEKLNKELLEKEEE